MRAKCVSCGADALVCAGPLVLHSGTITTEAGDGVSSHGFSTDKGRIPMKTILTLLVVGCASAQIQQPQLGAMLTGDGRARAVFGVTGSVIIGDAPTEGVLSQGSAPSILTMGCSRRMCLMKTDSELVSFSLSTAASPTGSMQVNAPAGPASFWFESSTAGQPALVYFPGSRQFMRWQNGQLSPVDFDVTGEILSIGEAPDGTLQFAVRNAAGTWIVRSGDVIVESLHGAEFTGPALLLHGGVLFATADGLILRRPDQSELVFKLGHVEAEGLTRGSTAASEPRPPVSGAPRLQQVALSWLGENYVQVRVRGPAENWVNYALRVDLGHERLFLLPEPQL
jgi:hypothetical protein